MNILTKTAQGLLDQIQPAPARAVSTLPLAPPEAAPVA